MLSTPASQITSLLHILGAILLSPNTGTILIGKCHWLKDIIDYELPFSTHRNHLAGAIIPFAPHIHSRNVIWLMIFVLVPPWITPSLNGSLDPNISCLFLASDIWHHLYCTCPSLLGLRFGHGRSPALNVIQSKLNIPSINFFGPVHLLSFCLSTQAFGFMRSGLGASTASRRSFSWQIEGLTGCLNKKLIQVRKMNSCIWSLSCGGS